MRTVIALLSLAGSILILGFQRATPERPTALPRTPHPLVIRTNFESRSKWEKVRKIIESPVGGGNVELRAQVDFIDEVRFRDLSVEDLLALVRRSYPHSILMVVDGDSLRDPELAVLVVDVKEQRGRTFRALPGQIQTVENNLSIANVDFEHFVRSADADGVYRGFQQR